MKRKLNEHDVPEEVIETQYATGNAATSFSSLGLDPRLLQAVTRERFAAPTAVQARAIPVALSGKDILARAKTGSGKTAAYVLPVLHAILKRKAENPAKQTSALVLVPTRELAGQVTKAVQSFTAFCAQDIRVENLTRKEADAVQRARLVEAPEIVVATPGRANILLNASVLKLDQLSHLVIDEADLILSYGYEEDLENISKSLPPGVQTVLMSATLRTEVQTLKGLFCRDPVTLELDDEEKEDTKLNQYVVKCGEDEKFLLIYAIFMLKLVKGKCIIFVSDIDRCYRLKLFLQVFGIKSCILNSELPVNSRIHVVEEFSRGVYDILIASDDNEIVGGEEEGRKRRKVVDDGGDEDAVDGQDGEAQGTKEKEDGAEEELDGDRPESAAPTMKKRKKTKTDKEYGVARGIDFKNVACVLNFDLPTSSKSYTHRIGRTARAGKTGMALSFVIPKELYRKHKPTSIPSAEHDEEVLAKIVKHQEKKGQQVQPYDFDMKRLEGFRYRMGDALRSVTRLAVREARTRELREELLKSEKLQRHFAENPTELQHLRHDQESKAVRVQPHMKHVPDYLLPGGGKQNIAEGDGGFVGFGKTSENRIRKARMHNRMKGKGKKPAARRADPLKTLSAKRR
ncbi:ATP-dependent DNA/RNA helicase [Taxawa tesnikishii (nom. ined.)]|nr:ATP-dependent DNA/RNA helicase [Dothideales sp. JES 119]